jgi:hypothetical protein
MSLPTKIQFRGATYILENPHPEYIEVNGHRYKLAGPPPIPEDAKLDPQKEIREVVTKAPAEQLCMILKALADGFNRVGKIVKMLGLASPAYMSAVEDLEELVADANRAGASCPVKLASTYASALLEALLRVGAPPPVPQKAVEDEAAKRQQSLAEDIKVLMSSLDAIGPLLEATNLGKHVGPMQKIKTDVLMPLSSEVLKPATRQQLMRALQQKAQNQ